MPLSDRDVCCCIEANDATMATCAVVNCPVHGEHAHPELCDGYPPNHPAGECPWCDEVKSTLHIINTHRTRHDLPLIRDDDPRLQRLIVKGGFRV